MLVLNVLTTDQLCIAYQLPADVVLINKLLTSSRGVPILFPGS